MKINILANKISWFGKYSGYECLTQYFSKNIFIEITNPQDGFFQKIVGKLFKMYRNWNIRSDEVYAELCFIKKINTFSISHILYLENHVHALELKKSKRKKIVGTIHLPFSQWSKGQLLNLRRLENAIILYDNEVDKFGKYVGAEKIYVIKHGVDVDFFCPDNKKIIDKNKIVFIGHFLRDFEMFLKVFELLKKESFWPQLKFHFIIPSFARENPVINKIINLKNVFFHEGLSDDELLDFYQTSNLLLMPMIDSGANTAIVQAISSGLPVVTNDIGGIRSYGGGEVFEIIENNNSKAMADLCAKYYNDSDFRDVVSKKQRQYAIEQLDWNIIAKQHLNVYRSIINKS